ncbi:MAG: HAD hydrolase-like protein [Acidobacteriota bacterium]
MTRLSSAVFFDLDGTLTDPKVGITTCLRFALESVGCEAPSAEDLTWCIGPPLLQSLEKLVGRDRAPAALQAYRERFSEVGWSENSPYDGIGEALAELQNRGRPLFVATSKPHVYARRILHHFELAPYFIEIFGAELDGTRSDKSELLRYALSRFERSGEQTMVGDRSHDVVGALANGMTPIGVSYGYGSVDELESAGAKAVVAAPEFLVERLVS